MTNNQYYISDKNYKICYQKSGFGSEILVALHGYGLDKTCFNHFNDLKEFEKYTIYSFDLFFHGNSTWDNHHLLIDQKVINDIFDQFLEKEKINCFDVLSYSLGSRIALNLILLYETRVKQTIFIAPDGISQSIWYRIATQNYLGRFLFKKLLIDHDYLYKFNQVANKLKLVDSKTSKFAQSQMKTKELRLRLYLTWVCMRNLYPNIGKVLDKINDNKIDTTIYWGKFDDVIPLNHVLSFNSKINNQKFITLTCGHTNMIETILKHIKLSEK